MEKTGSTAIQIWMKTQRTTFGAEGWYVPRKLGKVNHRKLSILGFNPDRRDDATYKHNITSDKKLIELQNKIQIDLIDDIDNARKTNKNQILASSELISSRLTTTREIERLINAIKKTDISQLDVVLFIRDAADLAQSRHTTAVLHEGRVTKDPPIPGSYEADLFGNQSLLIEKWKNALEKEWGGSKLIVIEYEQAILKHGSTCSALAAKLKLSKELYLSGRNTTTNKALPKLSIDLLRLSNKIRKKSKNSKGIKKWIFEVISKYLTRLTLIIRPGLQKYKMPANLRNEYKKTYKKPHL
ncbi:hypothetical protein [Synechococcus sp. GEYO]|uniref:hypothetical protein n=1 Tax=Synechococcus sp. GEYO TaxID=2575511 RepID=UPI0010BDCEB5|nr:hypothetical protein [Synechococcus sp. GEYO]